MEKQMTEQMPLITDGETAVVVLSGGQDSVTCLGVAMRTHDKVHAIGFSYGQRHSIELQQAQIICDKVGVEFTLFDLPALRQMGNSALIGNEGSVNEAHPQNANLPASFVPNRNALFLTTAHAFAQKVGAKYVYTGTCETDYSGYPDCRARFIDALERALNIGYETEIYFVTPLMKLNKAETFKLAEEHGCLQTVLLYSHTCYNGDRSQMHAWGAGCGECPACELRAKGYAEYEENLKCTA